MDGYERAYGEGVAIARPGRGLVRIGGPQREWFLQNTITNDVEGVPSGRWVESCFLDRKGKVLAHFRVGVLEEEMWLDVDAPGTGSLVEWFVGNRFRTKVDIDDVSRGCVTIIGASAREVAGPGEVVRDGDGVAFGWDLGPLPAAEVHPDRPRDGVDETLFEVLRAEHGLGRFGVDYGPDTLPQEAGLTHLVSVTKGCYIGQEVMARLHFRGHVNRVLRTLGFSGDAPATGARLLEDGKVVGTVTTSVESPRRGPIGLGLVRVSVAEGAALVVEGGPEATVGPIPEGTKISSS